MRVLVITPPDPVVTLEQAKAHLKVDADDEDVLIEAYVAAATGHIDGPDGWLGRALGAQVLEARCDAGCGSVIRLPFRPIIELVSVSYLDGSGVEQMADLDAFDLRGCDLAPVASSWPWAAGSSRAEAVRVRYRAGYPDDPSGSEPRSTLPPAIRAAILLMIGDLYRNRSTASIGLSAGMVPMSTTVENLLAPFRVFT